MLQPKSIKGYNMPPHAQRLRVFIAPEPALAAHHCCDERLRKN
jgi:hypothetical protein